MQMMTNGEYKSIEHRVVVNLENQRLSIGAFLSPDIKTMIGPLPDLVKQNGPKYKNVSYEEYLEGIFKIKKLDSKSLIDQMKLEQWLKKWQIVLDHDSSSHNVYVDH